MKAVRIHEFGGLDVLNWEDAPDPEPRPHQVLIKVDAAGVNYADLMRRGGNYPGPDLPSSLGLEAAGTVVEVGSDVAGNFRGPAGDGHGPRRSSRDGGRQWQLRVPVSRKPWTRYRPGGMPIVFLTAYHLLKTRGHLEPGHTVLIQAGASGVGTVAIQLAKAWGARVVVTASTQEKLDLCRSLGADETINYTEQDFEEVIKDQTGGNGVELILECVGGPVLEKSLRCVASYGRMLTYGNASGTPASLPAGEIFAANRTVIGFSIGRSPVGTLDHQAAMAEIFPLMADGKARLIVDQVLSMSEVATAHQHLANRGTRGKVILTP